MRASARTSAASPWERFAALPEDDRRELIAGELVETDKLAGYARVGVAEYWLVSQTDETVTQLHLKRGKYVVAPVFAQGDVVTSARFPGLRVPVSELFVRGAPPKPKATPKR